MENQDKKQYTAEEKVAILRRPRIERVTGPDLCDEYHLHPTVFYRWLKQFFDNGAVSFAPSERPSRREEAQRQRIEALEAKLQWKDEVLAELMEEHVALKKSWGDLEGQWVPHDPRDQVIDFVRRWSSASEIAVRTFVVWLGVATSQFYDWRGRYGRANEHNGWVPRDFGLEAWEKRAILDFYDRYPLEGYRRLTFMMLDANVVAASVWRVLHAAGRLLRWNRKASSKGQRFQLPLGPHKHWHVDISYVNLAGSVLDSYSRYLVPGSCGNR